MTTPGGGEPRTVDVPLSAPAPTVTYTLPRGVTFDVEAVYIEVDTTGAGGAVTAELSIAEQSGVVIARKAQTQTIDAGSSGSATWALRLGDEAATTPGGGGIDFATYPQDGDWLYAETTDAISAAARAAIDAAFPLLNTTGLSFAGLLLIDSSGNGLNLYSSAGPMTLLAGGDDLNLRSEFVVHAFGDGIFISGSTQGTIIQNGDGGGMSIINDAPTFSADLNIQQNNGAVRIQLLHVGDSVIIESSATGPIFEVRRDGSIHGRAAVGAITWDL